MHEEQLFKKDATLCGRFRVIRVVGNGSTAQCYLCHDDVLGEEVVCKVAVRADESGRTMWLQQHQKLRSIYDPHVVRAYGLFEAKKNGSRYVLVLEHISGPKLSDWCRTNTGTMERLQVLVQVASALAALHGAGVTHGDLSGGENVQVEPGRGCVLIDPYPDDKPLDGSEERLIDLQGLASLIEMVAPNDLLGLLRPVVGDLRASNPRIDAAATAATLRHLMASFPMSANSLESIHAAGLAYRRGVEVAHEKFQYHRRVRSCAIRALRMRMKELAEANFGLIFAQEEHRDELEILRDSSGSGLFLERAIICNLDHVVGRIWSIRFEENRNFEKPWPYGDGRTLARGEWEVAGAEKLQGKLQLLLTEGGVPTLFHSTAQWDPFYREFSKHSEPVPVDDSWIVRCLSALTGTPIAAL